MSGHSWVGQHKKELLGGIALAGLGAATGGFGLMGGGLLGGLGAGATGAATTGLAEGLPALGPELAGVGYMGSVATPMSETAMLAAPQLPTQSGLLAGLQSSQFGNAMRLVQMANSLGQPQAQQQNVQMMPRPQVQSQPPSGGGLTPDEQRKLGYLSTLGYLNG
jgi:hypothetical protein